MGNSENTVEVQFELPTELVELMDALAKKAGQTRDEYVTCFMQDYLEKIEAEEGGADTLKNTPPCSKD